VSEPLSIWLEEDILQCIQKYNIPKADIYHKGASRTGCMFCGFGAQFDDDNRFNLLYSLYPKAYKQFLEYENCGVTYRTALRQVFSACGKCLHDEAPPTLFG
jgi:3'-phosphoadenosine 5'-phosphosulfate sulfotransferase (PAPS reductase)/FAD synthetase